jgi:hypothetical protein
MGVQFAGNILVQSDGGPLPISQGGTGQTTAPTAINALLPVQTGQSGKVLTTNGTNVSWSATAGGSPGGADTQIQFNDSGTFGGSANFSINKTTGALTALSTLTSLGLMISGNVETTRALKYQTAGSDRWLSQANNTAETGASAGSDFEFVRVADNGATQNQVYTVARSTGVVDFKVAPTVNGSPIGGGGSGTVTSVSGTGTVSGLTLSGTVTSSGNLTLGGTLSVTASNFSSQTANTFLAAPNGSAGTPTFRAIVAADVPTLNQNTTGTASNVTGTVTIAHGGTGSTTSQQAINALVVNAVVGTYLRGDGTNAVMSAIQAADVPTLNQNTTGSAATATTATNIAGGGVGYIPYQSAAGTTAFLNAGTSGYVLTSNGAGIAPVWSPSTGGVSSFNTRTGAVTLTSGDVTTALTYTPVNKAGDTMTGLLVLSADPTAALGAATKQYVDNMAAGVNVHAACETATSAPLAACTYSNGASGVGATLTANANGGLGAIGGYTPVGGWLSTSRILVKDQATGLQNGIYVVTQSGSGSLPWILTRATDFDGSPTAEISAGDLTFVQEGTLAGTQWVEVAVGTGAPGDYIIIGTDAITFSQFSGAGTYTAGTGLSLTGTQFANTGVTSNIAGTNITVSSATGAVTIGLATAPTITGTNISGTAASLSIGGNAATATTATNIAGGAAGSLPYQSGSGTTTMLAAGTNGYVLTLAAGVPTWSAASGGGATITDDLTTNATYYPTFATATSGTLSTVKVSSTQLTYNPSTGTLSSTIFNSLSDARAKTNIRSLGYGLNTVLAMTGHKYEMAATGTTSIGLVAQEVQEIVPEVVSANVDGMLGINYPVLTAVLIEAIKELTAKVASLENMLNVK